MEDFRSLTVVMHTYERPDFVEKDVREGRWEGIPLLIVDDASRAPARERLEEVARAAGATFVACQENGGPARAARAGVEACPTDAFMLCGDDDYLKGYPRFSTEALRALEDPETLFASMPEVRFVIPGQPESVQFDRRAFDGMSGLELLRELVLGGEMRALQAGTAIRRDDALPHFAESLFRTSEDFVLLTRLCSAHPAGRVRVMGSGAYMRREHEGSLSHRKNMSPQRAVVNLLALLVGGRLLQRHEPVSDEVLLGLIRQRGQILGSVYGTGPRTASVLEAVLANKAPDTSHPEAAQALRFLLEHREQLPEELAVLKHRLALTIESPQVASPETLLDRAASEIDAGRLEEAETLLAQVEKSGPELAASIQTLRGRISLGRGKAEAGVNHLALALVIDPEHIEALHLLMQVARAAEAPETAARLENRLLNLVSKETASEIGLEEHPEVEDLRVAFIVSAGLDQFLDDIVRELLPHMDARKFVVAKAEEIEEAMSWADVCWFEWCNDPLVWASRQDLARNKPLICRLHRYEAFTDMPLKVQWDQVDALVVVAEHLEELVAASVPGLKNRTAVRHIPNGVDMTRYELKERQPGFEVALIGYLHGRKNPQMALQIMRQLVDRDPRYRLHVAGKFQDPVIQLYWSHQIKQLGLTDNVVMYEWQDDIAAFLEDKQYILSTSLHESFGYSIAEAMARGMKPVVHHFPYASDMWAEEMLFNSVTEAVEMIASPEYTSAAYRDFIERHYSLDTQITLIRDLIGSVVRAASGAEKALPVEEVLSIEPGMVNAELSCRCPSCRSAITLLQQSICGHPIGRERCPACGRTLQVSRDAYRRALLEYRDAVLKGRQSEQTMALRTMASQWAEHPVWRDVMTVDGLNLGRCLDHELTPHLVRAWLKANTPETAA